MLKYLNTLISNNITPIILSGILIGLTSNYFGGFSNTFISTILFLELFIACFKINIRDAHDIKVKSAIIFLVFRYFFLSIAFYYIGSLVSPYLGITLLLITLLPTGVSSPGFASLFESNVVLVLSLVIVSSLLSPFYIPYFLEILVGSTVTIDSSQMLFTIFVIVIIPTLIHIPLRKVEKINNFIIEYNPLLLMPLVWIATLVPISRYRNEILNDITYSIFIIGAFLFLYLIFILFGALFSKDQNTKSKKSYMVASCINNITLGVVIAFLYLPKEVCSLMVFANISLLIMISPLKTILIKVTTR